MFKRIGALAILWAGSMAVFTPAVAQARECGYPRYERRVYHDRCYRPVFYRHCFIDRFGRRVCR